MDQQQAATPSDAAPEKQPEQSLDDKILAKFGLGDTDESDGEPEGTPAEGEHEDGAEAEPVIEEEVVETPAVELFEFKHNGEQRKIPVDEARNLIQKGYDYDFKMQRVNEDAQRVQGMAQAAQARAAMQAQAIDALAEAKSFERQLKPYANVDWAQASQVDPNAAFQARMQYDQLMSGYNGAMQKVNQLQQPLQQATQYIDAAEKALELQKLTERIPEWKDPARKDKDGAAIVEALSKSYGVTPQEFGSPEVQRLLNNHKFVAVLRDAWKYREAINTKGKKGLPQGLPAVAKPGAKPQPRSQAQSLGDIKRGLRQVQDPRARKALEEELIVRKFGLK